MFTSNVFKRSPLSGYDLKPPGRSFNWGDPFNNDEEITKLYLSLMSEAPSPSEAVQDLEKVTFGNVDLASIDYSSILPSTISMSSSSSSSSLSTVPTVPPPDKTIVNSLPVWSLSEAPVSMFWPDHQNQKTQVPVAVIPSFDASNSSFVNVYLLVDPVQNKVVMPQQTLRYENQICEVSETELPAFPKEAIESLTQQVILQQQQQQQQVYNFTTDYQAALPHLTPDSPTSVVQLSSSFLDETATSLASNVSIDATPSEDLPAPLRALSAYNYFFRDERERLLENPNGQVDVVHRDLTPTKQQILLSAHWSRNRSAKRPHRKSHGKISFSELSRRISSSWKKLGDNEKAFYKEVASQDWHRYQRELRAVYLLDTTVGTKIVR